MDIYKGMSLKIPFLPERSLKFYNNVKNIINLKIDKFFR